MFLIANLGAALDCIEERAADVRRAFTAGALPQRDDVATATPATPFHARPALGVGPRRRILRHAQRAW